METTTAPPQVTYSSEALELLSQSTGDLRDLVSELATEAARIRVGRAEPLASVDLEAEDIVKATQTVAIALKVMIDEGRLSPAALKPVSDILTTSHHGSS